MPSSSDDTRTYNTRFQQGRGCALGHAGKGACVNRNYLYSAHWSSVQLGGFDYQPGLAIDFAGARTGCFGFPPLVEPMRRL